MISFALVLAVSLIPCGAVFAESQQAQRTIKKEPVYRTANPQYGLLTFSADGKDRVWLVRDGDTLYVDRNGNGDLTETGEKVTANKREGGNPEEDGYTFDVGEVTVGGRSHEGLRVYFVPLKSNAGENANRADVKAALAKDSKAMAVMISADVRLPAMKGGGLDGRVEFSVGPIDLKGPLMFADTPAQAPVVSFGGPLQVTFFARLPLFRLGRENEFDLVVGSPGIGPGTFASMCYTDTIPDSVKPVAEITFQPAKRGDPPPKERFEITDRC